MKTNFTYMFRYLISCALMLAATTLYGSNDKYTRTIKKEYTISGDAHVLIDNKYGKIHCSNWDRNMVSIEVTITVDAASEQKAAKVLDMISINMGGSASEVRAVTDIDGDFSGNNENISVKIDYTVFMPVTVSVTLENKFGDIYLEDVKGPASIDLSYGNMEAKNLFSTDNELEISFSKASIESIAEFTADIKYSEMIVYDTKKMTAESKFSVMRLERITYADIDSQYDTYTIGDMQAADVVAEFSTVKVSKLLKRFLIDSQYGAIQVKYVAPGFSEITVDNAFGNLELGIDEEASYAVEATINMGSFSYPKENALLFTEKKDYTTTFYKGTIGPNNNPTSRVSIESANAGVTIKSW